jgi:hypothetical protein
MLRAVEMLGRVLADRTVAAADVPAGEAQAQVYPLLADPQALLATGAARGNRLDMPYQYCPTRLRLIACNSMYRR